MEELGCPDDPQASRGCPYIHFRELAHSAVDVKGITSGTVCRDRAANKSDENEAGIPSGLSGSD